MSGPPLYPIMKKVQDGVFNPSDVLDWFVSAKGASNFNLSTNTVDDWLDQKGSIDLSETLTNRPEWDTVNGVDFATEFLKSSGIGSFGADTQGELIVLITTYDALAESPCVAFGKSSITNKYLGIALSANEVPLIRIRDFPVGVRAMTFDSTIGLGGDKVMITASSDGSRYQGSVDKVITTLDPGGHVNNGIWIGDLSHTLDVLSAGAIISGGSPSFIADGLKIHFIGYKSGSELTVQERSNLFDFLNTEFTIP